MGWPPCTVVIVRIVSDGTNNSSLAQRQSNAFTRRRPGSRNSQELPNKIMNIIYYNISLPEGTYDAKVQGNLVNLVIEGVRYGFHLDKYYPEFVIPTKCTVEVKHAKH